MPEVTFTSIEALQQAIANLTGPQVVKVGQRAGRKIGEELKNTMQRYPGPSHQPVKWASEKQRRWYFAMRRKEKLPIKYTRIKDPMSQKLGQSWAVKQITGGAVVGNTALYGPAVQSDEYQTEQHKLTGWITDKKAVEELERSGLIGRIVMAEVHDLVRGVLG